MTTEALEAIRRQLAFLSELDRLKSVMRQSPLINRTRRENSAEHSWHLAMFALILSEHAKEVDALHVAKLLLLHDIIEIDAGDAPIQATGRDKAVLAQAERAATERIFALLPPQRPHACECLRTHNRSPIYFASRRQRPDNRCHLVG